ncbi:MAG: Trm112 family protein [Roseateles sp.]|uniref:Trm112 family protein n=1 Tax=Roseateles sp. TaxID=1971397 RepID=UPI0039E82522
MDPRLIEMLVCPLCKGPLTLLRDGELPALGCRADRLAFPIRDGIPLMLDTEARPWEPDAAPPAPVLAPAP